MRKWSIWSGLSLGLSLSTFGASVHSIYEVIPYRYLDRHSALSPLAFLAEDLPRIKSLGFDTVRLLPITSVDQQQDWPSTYLVMDQRSIEPKAGTPQELRTLVFKAHQLGLKIVLEWVGHNISKNAPLRWEHPEFFLQNDHGDPIVNEWQGVMFNFRRPDVRQYLMESMLFWVRGFDIDGYRADVATQVPQDFWKSSIKALRQVKPDFFMLAEINNDPKRGWPLVDYPNEKDRDSTPKMIRSGFNSVYDRRLYLMLLDAIHGEKNAVDLWQELDRQRLTYPPQTQTMHFTSCHDFDAERSSVTAFGPANRLVAALIHFLPGITLTFNGQELGIRQNLLHDIMGLRVWDFPDKREKGTAEFYTRLMGLKARLAFGSHLSDEPIRKVVENPKVFSFSREGEADTFIGVYNLTGDPQVFKFSKEAPVGLFTNDLDGQTLFIREHEEFYLDPWGFMFLTQPRIKVAKK